MTSTDPRDYSVERTSACQGEFNRESSGFGWHIEMHNKTWIDIPDNILDLLCRIHRGDNMAFERFASYDDMKRWRREWGWDED